MKGNQPKATGQYIHTLRRAAQRYGVFINREMYTNWINQIQSGTATFVIRKTNRISYFIIQEKDFKKSNSFNRLLVAYDKKRGTIATILPPNDLKRYEQKLILSQNVTLLYSQIALNNYTLVSQVSDNNWLIHIPYNGYIVSAIYSKIRNEVVEICEVEELNGQHSLPPPHPNADEIHTILGIELPYDHADRIEKIIYTNKATYIERISKMRAIYCLPFDGLYVYCLRSKKQGVIKIYYIADLSSWLDDPMQAGWIGESKYPILEERIHNDENIQSKIPISSHCSLFTMEYQGHNVSVAYNKKTKKICCVCSVSSRRKPR